jgi:hypothetical protein
MRGPVAIVAVVALLALAGCGRSEREKNCEKLKERVITISLGLSEELQKYEPEDERLDREIMERQMREKLDSGDFMNGCMELDPGEVDCLANARTREEWVECGYDQLMLP